MATLKIEGEDVVVALTALEQVGALMGSVRVPRASVTSVRMTDDPYRELRGLRVGTGLPYVIVLGRMIFSAGQDFVAIYRTRPTAVIDLAPGSQFARLLVSSPDPAVVAALAG
ncbi:MAG: hypothetical protein J0L92_38175 [Deltaproteobacteria bacterium]|nr:hypothetical protein [Deltaproteobacteria bacterium]